MVHSIEHGYFGGYLVISVLGRPLEFHCSAPVRPNRAQEILYGPTLQPYLLGEQIGGTLLARATKLLPRLVLTDQPATLCLRGEMSAPLLRILSHHETLGRASNDMSADRHLDVSGHEFELPIGYANDREVSVELLAQLAAHVDLAEPFDRIHEAIREAQRIGASGQDSHGQAA